MRYADKIKNNNPIVYTIINNAFKNKKVPHAYLFSAQLGQEIKDEYLFVAQELISQNDPRDPNNYSDLITLDGSNGLIKKEHVINAINQMQQTTLDSLGIKILVIRNIENSNKQSLNSLLKFIEEPTPNTYILMTTNNIGKVLPTIKSRSQILSIKPINIDDFSKSLLENDVNEKDSRLLANIFDSIDEAIENYNSTYHENRKSIIKAMKAGLNNKESLITELGPLLKKSSFNTPLKMLREFISDIWREEQLQSLSFPTEKETIQKYVLEKFDFTKALEAINEFIILRNYYVNFDLDKNNLMIKIGECYE